MSALVEGRHPGEAIMAEGNGNISRENVSIPASTTVKANELLGLTAIISGVAAAAAAAAGNTGNGAMTLANPAVGTNVLDGVYTVTCIEPATNGGTFLVSDPKGREVGRAQVGAAYDGPVKFTIADGGTDFTAGDRFNITIEADAVDFAHVPFSPSATDGSETPVAMSIYPAVTGAGETKAVAVIARLATLNGNNIAWPDGITDAQKANAIQALADRNIIVR